MRRDAVFGILLWILLVVPSATAANIRFGVITDIHYSTHRPDNDEGNNRYYSDALKKAEQAADRFNADGADVIVCLGDLVDAPEDGPPAPNIPDIVSELDEGSSGASYGTDIYYCLGNHDCSSVYLDKSTFLSAVEQDGLDLNNEGGGGQYGYFDPCHGNLRCFILDSCYSDLYTPYPTNYNYRISYISDAQLNWLDQQLEIADDAGMFSILFFHTPLREAYYQTNYLNNSDDVLTIAERHRVILIGSGHSHHNGYNETVKRNRLGQPIIVTTFQGSVDGEFTSAGNNAYFEIDVEDTVGAVTIRGFGIGNTWGWTTANYFLATNGNDYSGNGTAEAPWRTIKGTLTALKSKIGNNVITENVNLWVKAGTTTDVYDEYAILTTQEITLSGDPTNNYRLHIRGYGEVIGDNVHATLRGSNGSGGVLSDDLIELRDVNFVTLEGLNLLDATQTGVLLTYNSAASDIRIVDCKIENMFKAVYAGSGYLANLLIENCDILNCTYDYGIVWANVGHLVFKSNRLDGREGTSAQQGLRIIASQTELYGNIIKHCQFGAQLDGPANAANIANNTFYDITSKCININSAGGVVSEHSNIYHVADPLGNYAIAREEDGSGKLIYSDYSITNGTRITRGKAGGDLLEGANAKLGATVLEIGLKDPNNDDFSLTADSLSLGTGRPSFYGGNADRGAWQGKSFARYTPPDCTAPLEMDFNNDCKVDMMDFALFASQWLNCNIKP